MGVFRKEDAMRCPRCSKEGFHAYAVCAECGFAGTPERLEELGHIGYLLGELETWRQVPEADRARLRSRYKGRREQIEIDLGLRPPPLTAREMRQLQWERFCLGKLQTEVSHWLSQFLQYSQSMWLDWYQSW